MQSEEVVGRVMSMVGKPEPTVLYIGTATYDLVGPMLKQTGTFKNMGCKITHLKVSEQGTCSQADMQALVNEGITLTLSRTPTLTLTLTLTLTPTLSRRLARQRRQHVVCC